MERLRNEFAIARAIRGTRLNLGRMMRRLAAGAALLLSVGALAGCGGDSDGGDDGAWPENVRSNFINACVAEDPAMEGYCGCMLEGLEEKYTIDEYIEVEREMEGSSGDQVLDEWGDLITECAVHLN